MKINLLGFTIDWLTLFGLGAQFLFFLRFIYQWLVSEKKKQSIIPIEFWYFSIIGGILIIIYAFLRKDFVFFIGQFFALFIYFRNLILFNKSNVSNISENRIKYETANPIKKLFLKQFLEKIYLILKSNKISTILDVGCGEGFVISFLKEKNKNFSFSGMDVSKKAIDEAKKYTGLNNLIVGDIYEVNKLFSDGKYDLVIVLEVLEHLNDPILAIKQLKKINSKFFIFSVPKEPWFSFSNLLMGKNIKRFGKDAEHVNFWTKKDFINLIKKDFKILEMPKDNFWTIILAKKND